MAAINEAWRVLGDPARRAVYDGNLRAAAAPPVAEARPAPAIDETLDFDDEIDARARWVVALPWLIVLAILVGIFLFTAYARGGGGPTTTLPKDAVDGVIEVGSCVILDDGARAIEAGCSGPHTGVTSAIVAAASPCPLGTEGFYDREGEQLICIIRD